MRWAACFGLVLFGLLLLGCGDSGSPPATANAGGAPPVPGGPPAGPPAPGGDAPPANPGETPPAAETPPAVETPPPAALPGGEGAQPGDPNNGNPGDDPNGNPDAPPRRPPPPRTLKDQSYAMFRMGNDVAGMKLLNAHFAIVPAAKQELAQKMGWYPGLMRPALAPRIGIGIHVVEQPLNFRGDPMAIGSKSLTTAVDQMQQRQAGDNQIGHTARATKFGRGMRGPMLDYSERAKIDQTQNWPGEVQVGYYLGDFGDWFIEALHERMQAGDYGPVLQDLMKSATRPPGQRRDPNDPNAPAGDGPPDYAAAPPDEGSGAPSFPGGGRGRGGRGGRGGAGGGFAGGAGFPGGGPGGGLPGGGRGGGAGNLAGAGADIGDKNSPSRWATKGDGKDKVDLSTVKQISPCLLWLGKFKEDEREDLTKVAAEMDVDILAVFSLTLKQARSGNLLNNKAILRLVNMRTGKTLADYSPEPIVNLDVEKWRQKDEKGTDPVEREVLKMLDAMDKVLKPMALPETVTAERAKKRIADLVAAKPDEPMPVLVEARYYFAKGLLGPSDFAETAKSLFGEEGFAKLAARAKAPIDE
jgi:hypothetical protein